MTQEPDPTAEELNLTDIASEMGLTLDPVEPEPPEENTEDAEDTTDADTESEADIDLSQDDDGQEPESEETSENDDSEDDSEAAEDDSEDTLSATQEKLLRRIDKITAKRREAEDRAEQLETELSDLRQKIDSTPPITLAPTPDNPLAAVETFEQLEQQVALAKKVRKWALENLEGGTVVNNAGEEVYHEPAQVRQYLANADEVLSDHAPKRREWIAQRNQIIPEAQRAYPALFKTGSQEQIMLRETLKAYPQLAGMPNLELVIGDAIAGQQLRFARSEQAKKSASPTVKSPAKAASAPSPAKGTKVPAKNITARATAENLFSKGSNLHSDDIAAFLEGAL